MLDWLTTDRYVCDDCGATTAVLSRWLEGPRRPRCKACGSETLQRRQGFSRSIRDVFILTNAS